MDYFNAEVAEIRRGPQRKANALFDDHWKVQPIS